MKEYITNDLLVIITNYACTLRCKNCANFIYRIPSEIKKQFIQPHQLKEDLDKLSSVLRTNRIQIQGGEATLHKGLNNIIDIVKSSGISNKIELVTNATHKLDETVIESLKRNQASVRISNYGLRKQDISQFESVLKSNSIEYMLYKYVGSDGLWFDLGKYKIDRNSNDAAVRNIFSICPFKICWTLYDGQLTKCSRSSASYIAGHHDFFYQDFVDVRRLQTDTLYEKLNNMLQDKFMESCRYCYGVSGKRITPGVQLDNDYLSSSLTNIRPKVAFYYSLAFQLRVLEPLAGEFEETLISNNLEELEEWVPDVVFTADSAQIPQLRKICDINKTILVGLRHGVSNKYIPPENEYSLADYVCGSNWDKHEFDASGVAPKKGFLITGNPWVDGVFRVPKKEVNTINPTILFAPTYNPEVSAAIFFKGDIVPLIREVYPRSKIIIKPHPAIIDNEHPYVVMHQKLFQELVTDWEYRAKKDKNVSFVKDSKAVVSDYFSEADILISDGSSLIFEFMALNRPILLYTSDKKIEIWKQIYDSNALANSKRNVGVEFRSKEEFLEALRDAFKLHEEIHSKYQLKYTQEILGEYMDGMSYKRVAKSVKNIFKNLGTDSHKKIKSLDDKKKFDSVLHTDIRSNMDVLRETENDTSTCRLISFYLPQYHPIPENDRWWGKGFTEWTNITKAKPLFPGHYQPHLPADLGFYDLRLSEVREAQAEMAKQYGISGFCYYHYWFQGKRLLNRVFDEVMITGKPDFPFCLCWANENWTRVWDGGDKKILMQQNYSQEDDLTHIAWLIKAFKDPRYIKVKGMPLLLIYRASELPDPAKTALLWREEVKKAGFPDLYLCKVESFSNEHTDIYDIGFDAAVEFQPDWSRLGDESERHNDLHIFDYGNIVKNMIEKPQPEYIRFPCVTPSWDNTPRRGTDGTIFHNLRPALYEKWLRHAISRVGGNTSDERIVFINAWNEWAEGNHLEPDQRYGHAFLHATRRAIAIDNERAKLNERLTNRAAIFLESGRLDKAKQPLMEALSYDSSEPRTLHQYAILLFQQGNLSESCETLIRALETEPWNAEFHNDLGAMYYAAHEISKAECHFEKALEINPQDITSLKNLTELLIDKGQFEDALDTCNRLNSLAPDDEEAINLRSIIYDKITFEDSVDFSNKALDVSIGTININKELKDTDKQLWPLPENASLQNSIFHKTLLIEQPKFHNDGQGNPISWNTNGRLLNFLDEYLQPGMHTLETGSGYSTVLFIGKKCVHTAVTPAEVEFNRISNYCKKHNLPLDHVRFIARDSAEHLPLMNENNLDVLFIDGAHRFPFPITDWFYGSKLLKQGGIAIVDDTDIISCFILRSFLERDDHWETVLIEKDFSVFRKLAGHDYPGDWPGQVFSKKKIQDAETFLKVFFDTQDNRSASRSGALKTPEIRPHHPASSAPQKPLKEPETIMTSTHSAPTNAEKPDVGTTKDIVVDWTPAFDYQTLTAEEIEEYSNIEVTEDLREGGIHAQKAWDYWFKYLSTNVWKTSLSAEIVSFCNTIDHPRILSLGCGYGGVELGIARQLNKSFQITAVDLNGQLFTRAIQEARANGFDIRFMALDLNYVKIHENSFDLIFAHASLHHLLNLEHVFLQIHRGLSENGRLIVQDIVGKTQILFWKDNVDRAIEIVRQMPDRYKAGIPNKQAIIAPYVEPTTQKGMEGIRQEEIPALLESFFAPVKVFPYGAFMRLICTHPELGKRLDPGRTSDRKYLEQIFKIDLQLIEQNKLRATEMLGVYQKRSAIDINGINSRAHMRLGELLAQQGKASHAFEHFKRAAIIDSGDSSGSHTSGIENGESDQLQQNDSHSVLRASHDILAQSPGNTETLLALGQEYLSRGDLDEAEQHLQAAVTQSPNEPRILHQYGLLLFQRGKVTESIANLILALEVDPYNAEFHNDLGAMYHASGDIAKAQEYFEKALEIKPDDITSLKNLTELYVAKEQLDDARNTCDKLKSAYPDDQEACNLWTLIKNMQGQAASKSYSNEAVGLEKKNSFRDNPATGGGGRNIIQDENHFTQDNKQNSTCLLSIIMLIKNDLEVMDLKIRSILEHVHRDDIELIVVDNGSHDGTIDYLRNLRNEKISVILLEKEVTFAQGGTLGAEKASGAFIMFLDNSVVITKPLLQSIMKILTNSPDLDAVVGKTVTKGKIIIEAGATTIGKSGLKSRGEGSPLYDPAYNFTCEVKSGSRHCMIMRRDVWEKVEGFNNDLEDIGAALIDLGMKITSLGYRILYQPQCILFYENPVAQHSIGKDIAFPDSATLASLRPKDLPIDLMNIINNPGHKNILVLGIYLANKMNTIHDIVTVFHGSSTHSVVQKWVALNGSPPDVETEAVTVKVLTGRVPKFQIINELLYEENLSNYDYIILCDDDVVLPKNFVDSFIAMQSKLEFAIAQPARTINSYIDHPIVQQHIGVHARQTHFVEIGPVVSFHRSAYDFIFPFDLTSSMGWGYENAWAHEAIQRNLKMGIIDGVCVDHSIREPVANYQWEQADKERTEYLNKNNHLPLEECFRVLNAHIISETST